MTDHQELVKAALRALDELVVAELQSDSPLRYHHVEVISRYAAGIAKMGKITRVRDAVERFDRAPGITHYLPDYGGLGDLDLADGDFLTGAIGGGAVALGGRAPNDAADLLREIIAMVGPMQGNKEQKNAAEAIESLMALRDRLHDHPNQRAKLDAKIEAALNNLVEENLDGHPALAHPKFLRRHQGHPGVKRDVQASDGEVDAEGASGPEGADPACGEA